MIRIRNLLNGDIRTKWRRDFYDAGYGPFVPFGALGGDPSPVINWDFLQSQSLTSFSRTTNATLFDSTGQLTYAANNLLLNTATLSTQTVTTGLQAGVSVILSFSGTGSVAISGGYTGSLAGTGVSDRVSLKFTTTTNSLTFTVTGSVTSAQLEVVTYQTTPSTYTATTSSQYYGPRYPYAYNGTTWDAQGLLVEAAATNLIKQSGVISTPSPWGSAGLTSNGTSGTSPDGSQAWNVLTENTANDPHGVYITSSVTVSSGATVTLSYYLKAGTRRYVLFEINGNATNYAGVVVDTVNWTAQTYAAGTGSASSYTLTYIGGGVYRVSVTGAVAGYTTYVPAWGGTTSSTGAGGWNAVYVGTSSTMYGWGFQAEANDQATSYIPTTSASVTRNADTSLAFSAISLPTGLSFSRASNAMQYDAAGRLTYAPHNLAPYSEDINSWNKEGSPTIATNDTEGPFDPTGTKTADKLTAGATGSFASYIYATYATAPTGPSILSVYVKKVNQRYVLIDNYGGAGDFVAVFDLDTGTHVGNGGQTSPANVGISAVGTSGWYRIWLRRDNVGAALAVSTATGNNTTQTSGDAVYIWGIQLENVTYETVARPYVANSTVNAVYGPRYDYDPTTRLPKGLLVEEGRTNYCPRSNEFTNASWGKGANISVSSGVSDPAGGNNAFTVTATANGSFNVNNYIYASATIGAVTGTNSIWIRRRTGTGTVAFSPPTGAQNNVTLTSSWQRFSASASVASSAYLQIDILTSGDQIDIYGAQIEIGAFATSYIPNPASGTTARSADLPDSTNATVIGCKTFLVETNGMQAATTATVLGLNAGIGLGVTTGNALTTAFGGTQTTTATATWTGTVRSGIAWSASKVSITFNGNTVTTAGNATSALTTTSFGHTNNAGTRGAFMNGWIRKAAGYSSSLSDASLATKSTVGANF